MRERMIEQHFREMVEKSTVACILTDPNQPGNPIVVANTAFVELVGYDRAEIVGQNCRFLAGDGTEEGARAILREAIANRRPAVVEITNYRRDGTPFRNAVTIAPLFDSEGRVVFFLGSQVQIASGGLSNRQRSSRERVAALSPRQTEVLALMAHGIRHAEIAERLAITEKTVKMHRAALVQRLGCRTSAEAIRIAIEAGL